MALTKKDKAEILEMIKSTLGQEKEVPIAKEPWAEWDSITTTKKLDCGLEIAMVDYYETLEDAGNKTGFTFDEALEIEKKTNGKWRVPTAKEWAQIVLELGFDEEGKPNVAKFVHDLDLTTDIADDYGAYWSSNFMSGGSYVHHLSFGNATFNPTNYGNRYVGKPVRCVRGDK